MFEKKIIDTSLQPWKRTTHMRQHQQLLLILEAFRKGGVPHVFNLVVRLKYED